MSKHYDVAVLGGGLGALAAAALLSRRSWRVLVLGQNHKPPEYRFDGLTLRRRPFSFLAATSPAWIRVLTELAQSQAFRRRLHPVDPMFQVFFPRRRLDVPPDTEFFAKEVEREFPEVRRVVDELYVTLAEVNARTDEAMGQDLVVPPGGFWERRETARVWGALPNMDSDSPAFLAEFARDHAFLDLVREPARFASNLSGELPPFALARLHGAWTRGVEQLRGGERELIDYLVDRIEQQGGDVDLGDFASQVVQHSGKIAGVVRESTGEEVGVQFLITDMPSTELYELVPGFSPSRRALAALPELSASERRFIVSMLVRPDAIPAPLGRDVFVLPARKGELTVHIECTREAPGSPDHALIVAEAILERDELITMRRARERVLESVERAIPFIEHAYVVVDSVHDGRPVWDYRSGRRVEIDRVRHRAMGLSVAAEPMPMRWSAMPPQFYGLAGEPIRTALGRAYVVGSSVLPALGQEGELVAAWGAARTITKTDRRKEKMRRELWSKVEFG